MSTLKLSLITLAAVALFMLTLGSLTAAHSQSSRVRDLEQMLAHTKTKANSAFTGSQRVIRNHVSITAVWTRTYEGRLQTLVEHNGKWLMVVDKPIDSPAGVDEVWAATRIAASPVYEP